MRFPRIVCLLVCVAVSTFPLLAQSPNGNINGLVSDPSTAAVSGAEIVAVNDLTGVQYTTKTNSEGIYVLPDLPPGPYLIQVSKIGFKTVIKPDIVLNVQDALSINFTMPVGAFHEIITVQGGAPLVNTESAAVSTVIDSSYVENMPLNGRSFQDLILLTPGIVTASPQSGSSGTLGYSGEFSVNGQRTESNYYTVDGVSANVGASTSATMFNGGGPSGSLGASTALGTTQALVSVDDLQEFRVQSSSYSAEYGRNPGGQFAFQTKSGSNQWHGTAYDYLRNGFFDAADWFDDYFGIAKTALRQNDFGGTLGGPVKFPGLYDGKGKTFFFVSYEGLRLLSPQPSAASYVPDAALRANTVMPLQHVLNAWPVQSANGIDDTANGIAQFVGNWSNPSSLDSTSVRFDHTLGKSRLFFRFSNTGSSSSSRYGAGSPNFWTPAMNLASGYTMRTYTSGISSALSSHLNNEFRLNYSSNTVSSRTFIEPFGGSTPVDLLQLTGGGPDSAPSINFFIGPYFLQLSENLSDGAQKQWNLVDTVEVSVGRHNLKFGMDYRRLSPFATQPNPVLGYYYLDENAVESNSGFISPNAFAPAFPLYTNFSAFAQDMWKVSQRVNLSLGLRWDVNPAPGVTQGLKPYTIQGSGPNTWTLAPQGTPLWQTTWENLAPRLGIAYVMRNSPSYETVVRGAVGVFFDTGQQAGSLGFGGPGFNAYGAFQSYSFPGSPTELVPPIVNPPVPPFLHAVIGLTPPICSCPIRFNGTLALSKQSVTHKPCPSLT